MYKQPLSISLLVVCLLVLSSCKLEEAAKKEDHPTHTKPSSTEHSSAPTSEVLFSIDGKPRITRDDFEQYKEQFFKIQPQYKQILQFMPKTEQIRIDQNIFQNMMNEVLFQVWVEKNQIDQRKDYQDDYNMILDMAKRNLAVKYYQEDNPIKLSDSEIKSFYEDNKDKMPELMASPGGVNAKAVKFETEEQAKEFLSKVKQAGGNLEEAAKEAGHSVENLEQVNQMSFNVDTPVRQKLLAQNTFPADMLVKVKDNVFYVVHATDKEKPEYVPFEQVKDGLENYLKQQKMSDMLTKAAEDLKKKYGATENVKYFTQQMMQAEQEEKSKQPKKENGPSMTEEDEDDMPLHQESSVKGA